MIVVGSLLHATFFVLADRMLRPPPSSPASRVSHSGVTSATPITGVELAATLGCIELVLLLVYTGAVVEFDAGGVEVALVAPILAAGSSIRVVASLYALLVVMNGLHAGVFFVLLHELGAVQAALMKALQSTQHCFCLDLHFTAT